MMKDLERDKEALLAPCDVLFFTLHSYCYTTYLPSLERPSVLTMRVWTSKNDEPPRKWHVDLWRTSM